MNIIEHDYQCPIKPDHIVAESSRNFMGSPWKNMETEVSAYWLVKFAQHRDSWIPFARGDLDRFYHQEFPKQSFWFNKLTDTGHIQLQNDGMIVFTIEFVAACYAISPSTQA